MAIQEKKYIVRNLGFLYERNGYSWFRRHYLHRKTRRRVRRASVVLVPNEEIKAQVHKYYRISNIVVDETIS